MEQNNFIKTFKRFFSNNNKSINFIRNFLVLFLLWKIVFHFVWQNPYLLDSYNKTGIEIINFILVNSSFILELIGYEVSIEYSTRILKINNSIGVTVGISCIGYELSAIYTGLIIASNGSLLKKILFITSGISIIYILNLFRISALAILVQYNQIIWDLNHKLIFTIIIYSVIFFIWKYWLSIQTKGNNQPSKDLYRKIIYKP